MSSLGSRPITLTPRSVKSLVEIPVPQPTSTITVEPDILQVDMIKSTASGGYVGREAAYMFASPEKRSVDFILLSLMMMETCLRFNLQILSRFYPDGKPELGGVSGHIRTFMGETGWRAAPLDLYSAM